MVNQVDVVIRGHADGSSFESANRVARDHQASHRDQGASEERGTGRRTDLDPDVTGMIELGEVCLAHESSDREAAVGT